MNTADIIKKRREELGLSQEELAAKLGYKSRSSINKIELGLSDIPFSKIPLFAKALELEPEILMGWGKEKVNEKLEEVLKSHNKYPKTGLKGEFTITENINDEYIKNLNVENEKTKYSKDIQVEIKPLKHYILAEDYHQNYLGKNPTGYCHIDLDSAKKIFYTK